MTNAADTGKLPTAGEGNRTISSGECIGSIAAAEGYSVDTLWNDPSNAGLNAARDAPYVLLPGDRLSLPAKDASARNCATGKRHQFRRIGVPQKLRLEFHGHAAPFAHVDYILTIAQLTLKGSTDADGALEEWVPHDATEGEIRLILKDRQPWQEKEMVYSLAIGQLDPAGSESGARARLVNLGFLVGTESGRYVQAITSFQQLYGLEVTGTLDIPTQERLIERHGY